MSDRDPYEVLGVPRDAGAEEVKRAYRRLAMKHHPDRQAEGDERARKEAERVFKEASSAYAILSDPESRARYDRYGFAGLGRSGAPSGEGFQTVEDILASFGESFFGDLFGRQGGPRRGEHLEIRVEVSFEEAALGALKAFSADLPETCGPCAGTGAKAGSAPEACQTCGGAGVVQTRQGFFTMRATCPRCGGAGERIAQPCPECRGRGRLKSRRELEVRIPAGVEDGSRIRLPAQGAPGERGGPRGDLFCEVSVRSHPIFRRHENHLVFELPVSFAQAALGADLEVPTLKGRGTLRVPPGTQPGEVLRLKGEGLPDLHTGRKGDLLVQVTVEVPRKPSAEQERLLREYAETEGRHPAPKQKGFLETLKAYFQEREQENRKHG